jgi:hypothetical protein
VTQRERVRIKRLVLIAAIVAALAGGGSSHAGGIADEPCPNTHGENTNTCPTGTIGAPYLVRFVERDGAGCGPGRQTFHLDSGDLPPGLSLAVDGRLTGTPLAAGRYRFYVEMREPTDDPAHCAGKETQKQFTLIIRPRPAIIARPAVTPSAEVGVPLRITLRGRGGSGVFFWSALPRRLPTGVRLRADGSITGIPRRSGTHHLAVVARDSEGRSLTWESTLEIAPRLALASRSLPPATVARPYGYDVRVRGGVAPMTWRVARGRLPAGLRLVSGSGRLVGIPRVASSRRVTLRVEDALGVKSQRTLTIVVDGARP